MAVLSIVLISLLSVALPINARPQYSDDPNGGSVGQNAGSLGTNSVFRNDFHKLPPTVKTSFIVMMLTSFNKTTNDLNNACLQILAGQSVQTEMCTELKNMETQRQEAFQEFDNSLQDGSQKTLVDQFNQQVIKNNDMTFGDKCTKFFELLSQLDAPTKALLIKNMASKYQGHGTPTFGGSNGMSGGMPGSMSGSMPGSMSGTPGAGVFSGAMAPSSTGGAATTSGGSVSPCSIIENFMAKTAAYVESHQTTGPPSS
ncbi:unnamed protein product [Meloidogyne enterolobii]|uniref:Uncharacterized protein n=1 Tax=Meloidogyne enterolobii TaxID=390850 RepID=A0ACB1ABN4_MELEN